MCNKELKLCKLNAHCASEWNRNSATPAFVLIGILDISLVRCRCARDSDTNNPLCYSIFDEWILSAFPLCLRWGHSRRLIQGLHTNKLIKQTSYMKSMCARCRSHRIVVCSRYPACDCSPSKCEICSHRTFDRLFASVCLATKDHGKRNISRNIDDVFERFGVTEERSVCSEGACP